MARPKKDQEACAEERLIDAFWGVLETTPLRSMSIRTIAEHAGLNRGTFYYHFDDIDALTHRALEREMLERHSIMHEMLLLVSGAVDQIPPAEVARHMDKTALLIRQGGSDRVANEILGIAMRIWQAALCPTGEPLEERTQLLIRYNIYGIIGLFSSLARDGQIMPSQEALEFQKWNAKKTIASMCEAQGIGQDLAIERLAAALSLSNRG